MNPSQAANLIGCSPQHVRLLIRTGKLPAQRKSNASGYGYVWAVALNDVKDFIRNTPKVKRGFPRGKRRKVHDA